jgi:hypothetical protein
MALLFATQADATAANATIAASMGLGDPGDVTTTWDMPKEDANGKWVVTRPEDRFMAGVTGYVEGSPAWPADQGMGA